MKTDNILASASLQHKQSSRTVAANSGENGNMIDMGMGNGKNINVHKNQRKAMLKNIESDVTQFMKDFEETKSLALESAANLTSAQDDAMSSVSGVTANSKI